MRNLASFSWFVFARCTCAASRVKTALPSAPSEILRLHNVIHPIRSSSDSLKDLKRKPGRSLARAILSNQQNGRAIRDWQFEILQAPEVMNVKSPYHEAMI